MNTAHQDADASGRLDVARLTLQRALFFFEHPSAVERHVELADRERFWSRLDELVGRAEREQSLLWQAHQARRQGV